MRNHISWAGLLCFMLMLGGAGCVSTITNVVDVDQGTKAYVNEDYHGAYASYSKAAANGDPKGQYLLSKMMLDGQKGITKDRKGGLMWLEKAAYGGYGPAQTKLGIAYLDGDYGLPVDNARALSLLTMAGNQDQGEAAILLASMYGSGHGTPKNPQMAAKWFSKASELGYPVHSTMQDPGYIASLTPPRQKHSGKRHNKKSASSSLKPTNATRAQVAEAQQGLTDLGFNPGPVDGLFGRKTSSAIKSFQNQQGMASDGQVTPQLLQAIRNALANK